ncbi:MAG: aminomethyl-transferring glycine dehydrogenase subunit GcvPA [Chloroflexi bacterium]|nr:aminomethyl-transferring glycine dehydrogenase subunit GcvPA [Chloroflexota bacterium]
MTNQDSYISPYSPNTDADRRLMLDAIGVDSVDELFSDIPEEHRNPTLDLPPPMSEFDLKRYFADLASMNKTPGEYACFLGAGSYRHHIPAIVRQLTSRSEFMTAYTPYQPEISQGTLQTEFEFQTLCAQLTGMDVANAGMYDGSTSLAEAVLMAARVTRRNHVAVLDSVSPAYISVLRTYTEAPGITIDVVSAENLAITEETACLVAQQPNFLGYMQDMQSLSQQAHNVGALSVVYADALSMAMFTPPGDYGADIVASEGQALGVPPTFGGPYVGIFACKQDYIRQMPGRIVGRTVDTQGRTAYVLTLQTREQHIRRERATSNICTSVALIALMTTVYMAANGRHGMRQTAELTYQKSHYLASLIQGIPGYSVVDGGVFFQEFVVQCPSSPSTLNEQLLDYKIIGGLDISDRVDNGMLVCATEVNTREEIDSFACALTEIGASA